MIGKVTTIEQGLDGIEKIDTVISRSLESEDYGKIMLLLKERLAFIAAINKLKGKKDLPKLLRARIDKIFAGANSIQEQVKKKKDSISSRLAKRKKIMNQNKKMGY